MKEIGGYFGLELGHFPSAYHNKAIALNSARNALRYIIKAYHIKKMFVPYYTCPVVWQAIDSENCKIFPYDIDFNFFPVSSFQTNDFILYNNWFGICGKNINILAKQFPHLIVDNAQSFYSLPKGCASFYSPRKFFGLPDGGLLFCKKEYNKKFNKALSFDLCKHLLKRIDLNASSGYKDFQKADSALINRPIELMSNLTHSLMETIDYKETKKRRLKNFNVLHQSLKHKNHLKINLCKQDVPMVYPFYTEDLTLRDRLIHNKIYVATYWPLQAKNKCMRSKAAQNMAQKIVPLPIDQRYDAADMYRILEVING